MYPNGLPSWIVNYKLRYLEPIPIPKCVKEYYMFVYLRSSNEDLNAVAGLSKDCQNKIYLIHNNDLKNYQTRLRIWESSRNLSSEFLKLEREMHDLQPTVALDNFDIKNCQTRVREHYSNSLPKFIANQFLFGNEPVEPPSSLLEYYCFYERSWDSERTIFTIDGKLTTYDENPGLWDKKWKRLSADFKSSITLKWDVLRNNYQEAHDTWKRCLNFEDQQKFMKFCVLRENIKKLCQ